MSLTDFLSSRKYDILLALIVGSIWFAYGTGREALFGLELRKDILWIITIFCGAIFAITHWEERRHIPPKKSVWEIDALVRDQMANGDGTGDGIPPGFILGELQAAAREKDVPNAEWRVLYPQKDGSGQACYIETDPGGSIDFVRKDEDLTTFKSIYFKPHTLQKVRARYDAARWFEKTKSLESKLDQIEAILPEREAKMLDQMKNSGKP